MTQATKYNPKYLSAFFNLGATCYNNGQFQKSIEYYQQADKLKPNDGRIIYEIAASQYADQQHDKPNAKCKKVLKLDKENDNAKQLFQMLSDKTK